MHTQSFCRWERRYLNHLRLPSAWWVKASTVCEQQMDRGSIKSPLFVLFWLFIALSNPFCFIWRWYSSVPSASPCVGFKGGVAGSAAAPGQTDEPRHGPCPASAPSTAARGRSAGWGDSCWFCDLCGKGVEAQLCLPWTPPHSSSLPHLKQTAPSAFFCDGCSVCNSLVPLHWDEIEWTVIPHLLVLWDTDELLN